MYLKPKTVINVLFRIRQPAQRETVAGKAVSYLQTPRDFALFRVMQDCFRAKVTKEVGYLAQLAHV